MEVLRLFISVASIVLVLILFPAGGNATPRQYHHLLGSSAPIFSCACHSTSCGGIRWLLDGEQLAEEHHHVESITFNNRSSTSHLRMTNFSSEMDNTTLQCREVGSRLETQAWRLHVEHKDSIATLPNLDPEQITISSTQEDYHIYLPPSNYSYCVSVIPNSSPIRCDSSPHVQVPKEVCSDVCADCTVQIWVNTAQGRRSTVELSLWTEMDVNVTGLETDIGGYLKLKINQPVCSANISITDRDGGHSHFHTTTNLNVSANVVKFEVGELIRGHTYDTEIWLTNGAGSFLHRQPFVCCTHEEDGTTQNPPVSKASNLGSGTGTQVLMAMQLLSLSLSPLL